MDGSPNYYRLLGLEPRQYAPALSAQEVKSAYRRALLQHHPDKSQHSQADSAKTTVTVDDIALAYKTLSEPDLRAEYDHFLRTASDEAIDARSSRIHHTGLETIDLDDLPFDEAVGVWSRSCRCGDDKGFIVSETELEKNADDGELIVGCKGCSLWLRVLFGVEE